MRCTRPERLHVSNMILATKSERFLYRYRRVSLYRRADKSLARPGRKKAAPVKKCDGQREWIDLARVGTGVELCELGNEPPSSIKCRECSLFRSWSG